MGGSVMAYPMGEAKLEPLRVDFDRRLKLEFHGSDISSDAGLLPYRELDDALGLTELGGEVLSETRRGKNTRHLLVGLLRQSVFGRLAGYEDVNDAERLSQDPVMRTIVDRKGLDRLAASTSQMGRFETEWLATDDNLAALTDLSGVWIDRVHRGKPPKTIVLDMDSSVSPTYGDQEGSAYNGQLPANACLARGRETLVTDHFAGKAYQDRRQGRAPWPLHHFPDGGGRHPKTSVRRDTSSDRRVAASPFAAMTGLGRDTSRSPDRTGVCRAGRSAPSQCEMVVGVRFRSPINLSILTVPTVSSDSSHQSMPNRKMWLNCLWDDRRFVRHLGNVGSKTMEE